MNNGTLNKNQSFGSSGKTSSAGNADSVKDIAVEVKEKVVELTDRLGEVKSTVLQRGSSIAEKIRKYATANPMKAVAIAFAAGYFGMRVTRPLRWL